MHRFCLLLVALMILTSCGENQVAVTTQNARKEFHEAVALVQLVQLTSAPKVPAENTAALTKVTSTRQDRLAALNKYQSFGLDSLDAAAKKAITEADDYESFRSAVLTAATAKLKGLTTKGPTSQQVAALHLLAQVETLQSTLLRRSAIEASDQLANEVVILVASTRDMSRALKMAKSYETDDSAIIAKFGRDKTEVDGEYAKLRDEISSLTDELKSLNQVIQSQEMKRDAAFQKASSLRAQAFTSKGQEQYDLHIGAIEADQEGYAADQKAADAKVARDVVEAKLGIAEHDAKIYQEWSQGIQKAVSDAGSRKTTLAEVQSSVSKQVSESINQRVMPAFAKVSDDYSKKIDAPLEAAIAHANEAINLATTANSKAPSEGKTEAMMWMMDANVEKLSALADGIITTSTFGRTIKTVLERSQSVLGSNASDLSEMLTSLEKKNAAYLGEARSTIAAIRGYYRDPILANLPADGNSLDAARSKRIKTVTALVDSVEAKLNGTEQQLPPSR